MIGLSQSPNHSLIELFKHISVDNLQATQNNFKLVTKPQVTYIYKLLERLLVLFTNQMVSFHLTQVLNIKKYLYVCDQLSTVLMTFCKSLLIKIHMMK